MKFNTANFVIWHSHIKRATLQKVKIATSNPGLPYHERGASKGLRRIDNGMRIGCPLSTALVDIGFWFEQGNWRAGGGVSELDD